MILAIESESSQRLPIEAKNFEFNMCMANANPMKNEKNQKNITKNVEGPKALGTTRSSVQN